MLQHATIIIIIYDITLSSLGEYEFFCTSSNLTGSCSRRVYRWKILIHSVWGTAYNNHTRSKNCYYTLRSIYNIRRWRVHRARARLSWPDSKAKPTDSGTDRVSKRGEEDPKRFRFYNELRGNVRRWYN